MDITFPMWAVYTLGGVTVFTCLAVSMLIIAVAISWLRKGWNSRKDNSKLNRLRCYINEMEKAAHQNADKEIIDVDTIRAMERLFREVKLQA